MNRFWLEDMRALFSTKVVPDLSNTTDSLNALSRLVILIFLGMYVGKVDCSIEFLISSLGIIILYYYIQKSMNRKENFTYEPKHCPNRKFNGGKPLNTSWYTKPLNMSDPRSRTTKSYIIEEDMPQYFCNDQVPFRFNDPNYVSVNQKLAQGCNPKTKIPPVIVAPSHDIDFWKDNELITHSAVNSRTQKDAYLSGYAVSTCCGDLTGKKVIPCGTYTENFQSPKPAYVPPAPIPYLKDGKVRSVELESSDMYDFPQTLGEQYGGMGNNEVSEDFRSPKPAYVPPAPIPYWKNNHVKFTDSDNIVENFTTDITHVLPNESGWVNTMCGYNPQQICSNLPTNLPVGNCQQDKRLAQYNDNIFTQTIQPGVYTKTEINEPVNSNIGISYQQQFEPVTCRRDEKGIHYTQRDPRLVRPMENTGCQQKRRVTEYDVYDPRFTGYGTSYRSYTDPLLGQTRFMYDDVDAIRMPNYIVRSKIDHLPYSDSYGPIEPGNEEGNRLTSDIRGLVQDSWMRDSLQFRNDLSERLMRKNNAINWQRRVAPKYTSGCGRC